MSTVQQRLYGSISVQPAYYAPAWRDGIGAGVVELSLASCKGATSASARAMTAAGASPRLSWFAMNVIYGATPAELSKHAVADSTPYRGVRGVAAVEGISGIQKQRADSSQLSAYC